MKKTKHFPAVICQLHKHFIRRAAKPNRQGKRESPRRSVERHSALLHRGNPARRRDEISQEPGSIAGAAAGRNGKRLGASLPPARGARSEQRSGTAYRPDANAAASAPERLGNNAVLRRHFLRAAQRSSC